MLKKIITQFTAVLLLVALSPNTGIAQTFNPSQHAVDQSNGTSLSVQFTENMNTGTFNATNIKVIGSLYGSYAGTFDSPASTVARFNADRDFLPGELITVIVTTGVQNASNVNISDPLIWTFTAAASVGSGKYNADVTYSPGDQPNDVTIADFNNDGHLDLAVAVQNTANVDVLLNNNDGTYAAAVSYTGGASGVSAVNGITAADVDADGHTDLIVTNNLLGNNMRILKNDGDGTFTASGDFALGNTPGKVTTGDIDGDGDLDVVAVLNTGLMSRILNDGSGSFSSLGQFTVGTGPVDVQLGDLDNDNDLDAVVVNANSNNISILENNGSGGGFTATTKSVGTNPKAAQLGDFDGDNDLDVAVANDGSDNISVYINTGSGTFDFRFTFPNTLTTGDAPNGMIATDIDTDGDLDLVTASFSGDSVAVHLNDGSGNFGAATGFGTADAPKALATADLNGDNAMDLVAVNQNSDNISVLLNAGPPAVSSVSNQSAVNVTASANITVTFDTDMDETTINDGSVIVTGSRSGVVAGAYSYDDPSNTLTINPTNDFKAGEVVTVSTGDSAKSALDISLSPGFVSSFTVAATGTGNTAYNGNNVETTGRVRQVIAADLDNDGDEDLIGGTINTVEIFGNASGTYSALSNFSVGSNIQKIFAGDFDADEDIDLLIKLESSSNIRVALNNGSGTYTLGSDVTIGSGNSFQQGVLEDLDGDGNPDMGYVVSSGQIRFIWGNGDGTFNTSSNTFANTNGSLTLRRIAAGDVDKDGDTDLLVFDGQGDGSMEIMLNSGNRSFSSAGVMETSGNEEKAVLTDLNADLYPDIITVSEDSAFFSVALNDGDGTFGNFKNYNTGSYWPTNVIPFDYDGDGDLDLSMFANDDDAGTQHILYAYNNSADFSSQNIFAFSDDGSSNFGDLQSSFALTDVDGDGDLDLAAGDRDFGTSTTNNIVIGENVAAASSAPTTAASSLSTSGDFGSQINLSWTKGNGARRLVLLKEGTAVDATPASNGDYAANTTFGSGDELGTGNFAVYAGIGNSLTIKGLSTNTTYHASVFEYNGAPGAETFLTSGAPTISFTTNIQNGIPFDTLAGNALSFNGTSSNMEFFTDSEEIPNNYTIEMWVKVADSSSNAPFFARAGSSGGGGEEEGPSGEFIPLGIPATDSNRLLLGVNNRNFVASVFDTDADTDRTITSSDIVNSDQWYHLALTVALDATTEEYTSRFYVNGVEQGSQTIASFSDSGNNFYLGTDNTDYLNGQIDEFRFWGRSRTASEIRSTMHKTLDGFPVDLTAYWQFNESSGTTASEISSNKSATLTNTTFVTSTAPLGSGASNNATGVQSGSTTIGNATLSLTDAFDNEVDIQVTQLQQEPSNYPGGFTSSLGGAYFVINLFGTPGTFSADLTLNFGSGVISAAQEANPGDLKLYRRSSNSTGGWTEIASASSATASTGQVTWQGITSFSQFIAVDGAVDLVQRNDTTVTAFTGNGYAFSSDFFDLADDYADTTLSLTVVEAPSGSIFVDLNNNKSFDSGTETELNTSNGVNYTASGNDSLVYVPDGAGIDSVKISLVAPSATDTITVAFINVTGSVSLAGNSGENGWYLLSSPTSAPIGNLLDNVWTQGAVNSNGPTGDATIYVFDQDSVSYQAVTTDLDTTTVKAGEGVLVFLYEDDDLGDGQNDVDGGWPKTLTTTGSSFGSSVSVPVKNVNKDEVAGTSGSEGFILFGNPYGWPLSADSVIATLKRQDQLANSYVYRWNPTAKTYQILSSGPINPYESVFIRMITSGASGNLAFDYSDADASMNAKNKPEDRMELILTHNESESRSSSFIRFDAGASTGIDPYDGYYLGSYASDFSDLYTVVDDQMLTINNIPLDTDGEIEYPVYLNASRSGSYTLTWTKDQLPEGMSVRLINTQNGETTDLRSNTEFSFSTMVKGKPDEKSSERLLQPQVQASSIEQEPVLLMVVSGTAVNNESDSGLPREVELYQNYPNPFNPSSVIRYGVPSQSRVQLEVFDVLGRRVMTLINGEVKQPGRYDVTFDARALSSGIYIYQLTIGNSILTRKMTLIK